MMKVRGILGVHGVFCSITLHLCSYETGSPTEPIVSSPRNLPVFTYYSGGVAGLHAVTLVCSCCRSACLLVFTWMLGIYMQILLLMQCMFLLAVAEANAVSPLAAEENWKQYQDRHIGVIIYKYDVCCELHWQEDVCICSGYFDLSYRFQ